MLYWSRLVWSESGGGLGREIYQWAGLRDYCKGEGKGRSNEKDIFEAVLSQIEVTQVFNVTRCKFKVLNIQGSSGDDYRRVEQGPSGLAWNQWGRRDN